MDVLLLGNGFDLYHYLPTKYINFMHTMQFLIDVGDVSDFKSVGQVFCDSRLQAKDPFIAQCYVYNKTAFNRTNINTSDLSYMINAARNNSWFNWFNNCYSEDIGWVDFEKEIARIVYMFDSYTVDCREVYIPGKIIQPDEEKAFSFFNDLVTKYEGMGEGYYFNDSCTDVIIQKHGIKYINRERVSRLLYQSLLDFKTVFERYLVAFVEKSIENGADSIIKSGLKMFCTPDIVVTYNYTKTYEVLYQTSQRVIHVHGELLNNCVLGINADQRDELESADTSFIAFKKYFQRVKSNLDLGYIDMLDTLCAANDQGKGDLIIVGHSLDITDKDTIKELFESSSHIIIHYHSDSALGAYIANLITLFGKQKFDEMRRLGELYFIELPRL